MLIHMWNTTCSWFHANPSLLYRWLTHGLAATTLIFILTINVFFWPIPLLGFTVDPSTETIISVEPGSSAATAGLRIGDHVLKVYHRSLNEIFTHINMLSLAGPREQPVPVSVTRAGVPYTFELIQTPPDTEFQLAKVVNALVALLCWLTGYILGIVRRHQTTGTELVAVFWLLLSGIIGSYFFAWIGSYPLRAALQWLIMTIIIPLGIYIHVWFPVRPVPSGRARLARQSLFGSSFFLTCILLAGIFVWRPSLVQFIGVLSDVLSLSALVLLVGSGSILWRAYRRIPVAHTRRQIRLIALSCFFVAVAWLLLLVLPLLLLERTLIPDPWINMIFGIVPLAYLIGGIVPDLYRIDHVIVRLGAHLSTTTLLIAILATLIKVSTLQWSTAILWGAVCFVVLYRPLLHFILYRIFADASPVRIYHQLHISSTKLTTTLDAAVLIEYICYGIRTTFGQPALAFYLGDIEGSNNLTCKVQERMNDLPDTIVTGPLTEQLCQLPNVTESRELHRMFSQKSYSSEEEIALFHPGIVLWCPIRHTEGFLLGLLLLGMRSDLDPYRESDIQELQRLMDSAALALANSATYAINCRLHQRLQQERDAAAARIARELHDEIININVRLNIEALQRLAHRTNDPELRTELELMITSECALAQDLRVICEELHPTGIDDPFGLASVLLMQMDKTQANWSGTCQLIVDGTPCPITSLVQREALGIITEALTNVVKHAEATKIVVSLIYPSIEGDQVQLIIQDNGRTNQVINIKPGHWGVRGMQERAAAVGGSLQFRQVPEGGTAVVFTFPPITQKQ